MTKEKSEISKVNKNKKRKENDLFTAAYELFTTKGTNKTAIDEIVKKAGVAKGTFYLYFKDKYDIINKLVLLKSSQVIEKAMEETEKLGLEDFEEILIFFLNYVIHYFEKNKLMLKLISKDFACALFRRAMLRPEENKEIEEVARFFITNLIMRGMDNVEAEMTLFMVFELVGNVCYSSIILNEPSDINVIKPILIKKVLAMI
ncbi:MAG: TetR/AcrR family transcriptional regulator [Clostridiaceae bacterium]|nr:TetR/AcrR family transcriptional regulator [Clostridiaceae bacterium]